MADLLSTLQSVASEHDGEVALEGSSLSTYGELWGETDAFAGGLADRDVGEGDRVGVCVSDARTTVVAVLGALRNGSVPVTVPPDADRATLVRCLSLAGAEVVVTDDEDVLGLASSVDDLRVVVTCSDGPRMGVHYDDFCENSGLTDAWSRTGIDLVRRPGDAAGLEAFVGTLDGEPLGVRYDRAAVTAAALAGRTTGVSQPVDRHAGVAPCGRPLELLYGAFGTLLAGGRYLPIAPRDRTHLRARLGTLSVDRVILPSAHGDAVRGRDDERERVFVWEPHSAAVPAEGSDQRGTDAAGEPACPRLLGSAETGLTHVQTPGDAAAGRLGTLVEDAAVTVPEDGAASAAVTVTGPALASGYLGSPSFEDVVAVRIDDQCWLRTGLRVDGQGGGFAMASRLPSTLARADSRDVQRRPRSS